MALAKYLNELKEEYMDNLLRNLQDMQRVIISIERRRILSEFENKIATGETITTAELVRVVNNEQEYGNDNSSKIDTQY